MNIGEKIKMKREELNMTQEELASKIGYKSRSSINKIEIGEYNLKQSKIKAIADALQTTPAYIMGWEEETPKLPKNIIPLQKTRRIPILGRIACGAPILAVENIQGYFIADTFIKGDFILEVIGDSMINANIFDKDLAFIRKQSTLENGEIGAILIEEEATLKKFTKKDGLVILQAANPDCTDYPKIFTEGNLTILGKLVGIYSDRDR